MQKFAAMWVGWAPRFQSILRVVAAALFMLVGTTKLFGFPMAMPGGEGPLPPLILVAGILEVVGGALLGLGLFTRPVAFILSGQMAVAYFMGHAGNGFWPVVNGGTDAVLYCFIWLYFSAAGAGPWSLDAKCCKK